MKLKTLNNLDLRLNDIDDAYVKLTLREEAVKRVRVCCGRRKNPSRIKYPRCERCISDIWFNNLEESDLV